MKVLIWDYTGKSAKWCEKYLEKDVEVTQTVTPAELVPEILLQKDSWDWLLIFENKMRKAFDTTIQTLQLPSEKIIYARDPQSWTHNPKAIYTLLNDNGGSTVRKKFVLSEFKKLTAFTTCTAEDVSYVAPSRDSMRMPYMFVNNINWASSDMKRFYELAHKYYGVDDSSGYFLDLGANIGTTGIYFIKKLTPDLKLLAFEPDPENFKMHHINLILNDIEEKTDLVNCGLGNEISELMLYSNGSNSGANSFIKQGKSKPISTVKVIPLDSYFEENKIPAQEVKYIWIDTEGFEAQVLLGAKNLLRENPAPIFMECNLGAWNKSGLFDDMMSLLEEQIHILFYSAGEMPPKIERKPYVLLML